MQRRKIAHFSLWLAILVMGIALGIFKFGVATGKEGYALFIVVILPVVPLTSFLLLLSIFARLPTTPLMRITYPAAIISQTLFTLIILDVFLALPLPLGRLGWLILGLLLLPMVTGAMVIVSMSYRAVVLRKTVWGQSLNRANAQLSPWAIVAFIIGMIINYGVSFFYVALPEVPAHIGKRARINSVLNTPLPDSATNLRLVNDFNAKAFDSPTSLIRFDAASGDVANWLQSENSCFQRTTDISEIVKSQWSSRLPHWWQPDIAKQYTEYECDFMDYSSLIVDQTDNARWIVYIYAYYI
ncbi:hypothetical protein QGP82_25340 [Leptothoe sp. LEGE 181152]|nr:hypothetical protein [Leptothoe sp. LEGE 181152]